MATASLQPARHRTATLADLAQIVDIYNATIPGRMATADTSPVVPEDRVGWFNEHAPGHRPLWVIEEGNRVAAWLSFSSFYGRPAYSRTAELSLYVRGDCQRRGLGACLLAEALAAAPALQLDTLLGFIFGHNQPSLALFRRFGFTAWGELPGVAVLDGVERDLVIVGRRV